MNGIIMMIPIIRKAITINITMIIGKKSGIMGRNIVTLIIKRDTITANTISMDTNTATAINIAIMITVIIANTNVEATTTVVV